MEVAFNEFRLSSTHTSRNDPNVQRVIVTSEQAWRLLDAALQTDIAKSRKLIVDMEKISPWNYELGCYVMLHVFRRGTMEVDKRKFRRRYVQIKYFEASWPGAPVAHRIEPHPRIYERTVGKQGIAMVSTPTFRTTNACCTT